MIGKISITPFDYPAVGLAHLGAMREGSSPPETDNTFPVAKGRLMKPGQPLPSLQSHYPRSRVDELVSQARESLLKAGSNRFRKVQAQILLTTALYGRHQHTHQKDDVDEGIALMREAVSLVPSLHDLRTKAEQMLGMLLGVSGTTENVAESLEIIAGLEERSALNSVQGAMVLFQLGAALSLASTQLGNSSLLDKAVTVLERAAGPQNRAGSAIRGVVTDMTRFSLAMALTARYSSRWSSDIGDVDRVNDLLANLDFEALENIVPGFNHLAEQLRSALGTISLNNSGTGAAPTPAPVGLPGMGPLAGQLGKASRNTVSMLNSSTTYRTKGDLGWLDAQIATTREELLTVSQNDLLVESASTSLAQLLHTRFRNRHLAGIANAQHDLDEALRYARAAVDGPAADSANEALAVLAHCLLDRYNLGLGTRADLTEAISLLRRTIASYPHDSRAALAMSGSLAEALLIRGGLEDDWEDVDEAEDLLVTFHERVDPESPIRRIVAVRLAVLLQYRSLMSGETEDVLRASAASRASTAGAADVSIMWAYDSALHWARWAWDHGPPSEKADAYQQAVHYLHQLARAQLDWKNAELALRRSSENVLGRAVHALASDLRVAEAVVAAETGRGLLLSIALERDGPALDDAIPSHLRRRFAEACDRLRAAEAEATATSQELLTASR